MRECNGTDERETGRCIRLHPRLETAAEMLAGSRVVADVGCDHGRLACALVQRGLCCRCIAVDVSAPSLEKARALAVRAQLSDRVETRLGDGLSAFAEAEADAVALLGMGGTLMARLLDACERPLNGAQKAVLQPMRAAEDVRAWLYARAYRIADDRILFDGGRYYQVFTVLPPDGTSVALPEGWPQNFFRLGYAAFAARDPLLPVVVRQMLARNERRLKRGESAALRSECEKLKQILRPWEDTTCG